MQAAMVTATRTEQRNNGSMTKGGEPPPPPAKAPHSPGERSHRSSSRSVDLDQKEAVALLRRLRQDVAYLDGRLNNMAKDMKGAEHPAQDKLKQLEKEKEETEQLLASVRKKLEEHRKNRTSSKRQRSSKGRKLAAAESTTTTAEAAGTTTTTTIRKTVTIDAPIHFNRSLMEVLEDISENKPLMAEQKQEEEEKVMESSDSAKPQQPQQQQPPPPPAEAAKKGENTNAADLTESKSSDSATLDSLTEAQETAELEEKIKALESQKEEMEQTLEELLHSYEDKTTVLQKEKKRLADDKDTTYAEMKSLLVEQHQESERLRSRLTKLEKKRQTVSFVVRWASLVVLLLVLSAAAYVHWMVDDVVVAVFGTVNHACAPVRAGTRLSEATGPVEAPWWAPPYTKEWAFRWVCGTERPRIRLQVRRGQFTVSQPPRNIVLAKKMGDLVRVETERLHITSRGGGHQEMAAPWALPESSSSTAVATAAE